MAELHWFPFFAKDWIASRARALMTHEQRGVYLDLLAIAWDDGSAEPSLPADDASLASMTGLSLARWQKIAPLVRAQFVERDWRLYNEKLSEVWKEQQEKHDKAVKKAQAAVAAREEYRKTGRRSSKRKSQDHLQDDPRVIQSESEVEVKPLRVLPSTAPVGALGVDPPRAAGADGIPGDAPPTLTEIREQAAAIDADYNRLLTGAVERWRAAHPERWAELEAEERRPYGTRELSEFQAGMIRERVVERVRVLEKWMSRRRYGEKRGEVLEDTDPNLGAA